MALEMAYPVEPPPLGMWIRNMGQAAGFLLDHAVPKVGLPEMTFRWDIPDRLNAAERLRAEVYHIPYAGIVCYIDLIEALEVLKGGESPVHTAFSTPSGGPHRGVGFWETGRGSLTHYVVIDDRSLDTYQVLAPSTRIVSPQDPFGNRGPCEQAVVDTPLRTRSHGVDEFPDTDVLRAIRSFDPCMVCAVH